jgi:RHS repeat-associated protein
MPLYKTNFSNNGQAVDSRHFYHQDQNLRVHHLTDASGNILEKYVYNGYGKRTILDAQNNEIQTSAHGNRIGFQGREHEDLSGPAQEHGLTFHRNRFYDPDVGRWGRRDPMNKYAMMYSFCSSSPIRRLDIYGLDDKTNTQRHVGRLERDLDRERNRLREMQSELDQMRGKVAGATRQAESESAEISRSTAEFDKMNNQMREMAAAAIKGGYSMPYVPSMSIPTYDPFLGLEQLNKGIGKLESEVEAAMGNINTLQVELDAQRVELARLAEEEGNNNRRLVEEQRKRERGYRTMIEAQENKKRMWVGTCCCPGGVWSVYAGGGGGGVLLGLSVTSWYATCDSRPALTVVFTSTTFSAGFFAGAGAVGGIGKIRNARYPSDFAGGSFGWAGSVGWGPVQGGGGREEGWSSDSVTTIAGAGPGKGPNWAPISIMRTLSYTWIRSITGCDE